MLDVVLSILVGSVKVIFTALFVYVVYWRVIDYYHSVWFYSRQGTDVVTFTKGHMPVIGNLIQVLRSH